MISGRGLGLISIPAAGSGRVVNEIVERNGETILRVRSAGEIRVLQDV